MKTVHWLAAPALVACLGVAGCGSSGSPKDSAVHEDVGLEAAPDGDAAGDVASEVAHADAAVDVAIDVAVDSGSDVAVDSGSDVAVEGRSDASGPLSCPTYLVNAATYALTELAETAPVPAGGTIVDGFYVAAAQIHYTGAGGAQSQVPSGARLREQFLDGTWSGVSEDMAGATRTWAASFTVSGPHTLLIEKACGDPNATSLEFTATPTQIELFAGTTVTLLLKR